jgi:hypothetical protein
MKDKPRTLLKLNGHKRAWVCECCGAPYCDSMLLSNITFAGRKINYRKSNGLCIGCGNKECSCKNKNRKYY